MYAIRSYYDQIDDAVRGKTDELFSGPRSSNPQLLVTIGNSDLENDIEGGRAELESDMDDIVDMAESIKTSDDLEKKTSKARKITENTQEYFVITSYSIHYTKLYEWRDFIVVTGLSFGESIGVWLLVIYIISREKIRTSTI